MRLHTAIALAIFLSPAIALADILGTASVIDGDTIEIHGRRIRLHGIDAPESKQTCRTDGERWRCGQKASLALSDKIGRSPLRCEQRDMDRYGRIVATCYLGGEDLNQWMVTNGWALAYREYSRDYVAEELAARERRKGIWRGDFVAPWDWRLGARLGVHPRTAEPPEPSVSKEPVDPPVAQTCCKVCRKGKACGNSCIAAWKTCHKPPGCASPPFASRTHVEREAIDQATVIQATAIKAAMPSESHPEPRNIRGGLLKTQTEAAAILGVSVRTLRSEVEAGRLRYVLVGKRRRFTLADLDEYVENRRTSWPSTGGKGHRTGTMTSRSVVVGFAEALRRRTAKPHKWSRPNFAMTPCSERSRGEGPG